MALIPDSTPEPFSFKPEEWPKWIQRFERFSMAAGVNDKTGEEQVSNTKYKMS